MPLCSLIGDMIILTFYYAKKYDPYGNFHLVFPAMFETNKTSQCFFFFGGYLATHII